MAGWRCNWRMCYADALPEDISEPRVAIEDGRLTLGFRARRGGVETVISADAAVMLTDEGDMAMRLLSVHAGALPLPVMQVADDIREAVPGVVAAGALDAVDGQPVAIGRCRAQRRTAMPNKCVDAVELREGRSTSSGHTLRGER